MTASYASGTSLSPLLGETIGANLARTVNRVPDAEALVSCHQGLRYRYAELDEMIDLVARGLLDAGLDHGRPLGDLEPQPGRVGLRPVRHGQDRRDPRQPQPGVPHARAAPTPSTSQAAGCWSRPGRSRRPTTAMVVESIRSDVAGLEQVVYFGSPEWDGLLLGRPERVPPTAWPPSPGPSTSTTRSTSSTRAGRPGLPKGATLSHHNILNNGFFVGESCGYSDS